MSEPTSTTSVGITAIFIALFGPLAGEYVAIVFAALAGALWPLSNRESKGTKEGAMLLLRLVLMATVLVSTLAWFIESKYGIASRITLTPLAFFIGVIGDSWRDLFVKVKDKVFQKLGWADAPIPQPVTPKEGEQ